MSSNKLRFASGVLIASALASLVVVSAVRSNSNTAVSKKVLVLPGVISPRARQQNAHPRLSEIKKRFPKVDYDAPEPTDPAEKTKRRNKGKHYDRLGGVSKEPTHYSSGLISHWEVNLPALPVAQSTAVVIGNTLTRAAFLSADKGAVYTELSVKVEEILKGTDNTNGKIDVKRLGGVVRYRTGEESFFHIVGQNMPDSGKRYLFFLRAIPESEDFEIVTGYELAPSGVTALDTPAQFTQYNGLDEAMFLEEVRRAVLKKQS